MQKLTDFLNANGNELPLTTDTEYYMVDYGNIYYVQECGTETLLIEEGYLSEPLMAIVHEVEELNKAHYVEASNILANVIKLHQSKK